MVHKTYICEGSAIHLLPVSAVEDPRIFKLMDLLPGLDKNLVFSPGRIDDKFYFLHCIKPDIQMAAVPDLSELTAPFWED